MTDMVLLALGQVAVLLVGAVPCGWLGARGQARLALRLVLAVVAIGMALMWKATTIPGSGGWLHMVGFFICIEIALAGLFGRWIGQRIARRREAER